jgi:chorismate synthase
MSANRFGSLFQLTSFGESHGVAMGAIVEGCPSGVKFDEELLRSELLRRRPGRLKATSGREEEDQAEILSGVFEGKTLGTPIAILIRNQDARPQDYEEMKTEPRTGHADDVWKDKFSNVDHRGGGRSSGRETVSRVIGGAVAQMFLRQSVAGISIQSELSQIGPLQGAFQPEHLDPAAEELLVAAKREGRSFGAKVQMRIENVPQGLGQPVFRKLKAELATALMGVGAVIAIEFGEGVEAAKAEGTQFHSEAAGSETDRYGGIRGGISTGDPLQIHVTFKPPASVLDVAKKGRHDPCIAIRAIPVLEAMVWLVLADHLLWMRLDRV